MAGELKTRKLVLGCSHGGCEKYRGGGLLMVEDGGGSGRHY